ncbi:MAG: hypothetical protein FD144_5881, partial [Rhodospirillaceae bacterium]
QKQREYEHEGHKAYEDLCEQAARERLQQEDRYRDREREWLTRYQADRTHWEAERERLLLLRSQPASTFPVLGPHMPSATGPVLAHNASPHTSPYYDQVAAALSHAPLAGPDAAGPAVGFQPQASRRTSPRRHGTASATHRQSTATSPQHRSGRIQSRGGDAARSAVQPVAAGTSRYGRNFGGATPLGVDALAALAGIRTGGRALSSITPALALAPLSAPGPAQSGTAPSSQGRAPLAGQIPASQPTTATGTSYPLSSTVLPQPSATAERDAAVAAIIAGLQLGPVQPVGAGGGFAPADHSSDSGDRDKRVRWSARPPITC